MTMEMVKERNRRIAIVRKRREELRQIHEAALAEYQEKVELSSQRLRQAGSTPEALDQYLKERKAIGEPPSVPHELAALDAYWGELVPRPLTWQPPWEKAKNYPI